MPLDSGTRLGPYEIVEPLGQGGMADVYRAHDSRLGRQVAIKVAGEQFTDRFAREARAVAALNHPNICTLYDVGPDYLVMELVDGPTLAEHLTRSGPLSVDAALRIMRQVADALDAAHAQGIAHRDLKPANIKVKPDGTVKVLDFGLAKHVGSAARADSDVTTMREHATREGLIVGTTAYMAPEQTRGEELDTRVDVWAFGVVLLELVTGASPFARPTTADTVAAVLHHEPEWSRAPQPLRRLIRTCLEKDPTQRLRHIADARLLIDDESRIPTPEFRRAPARWPWAIAGAAVIALIATVMLWAPWRAVVRIAEPVRFQFAPAVALPPSGNSAVSPDGRRLAFPATGSDGVTRIWIRDFAILDEHPLPGSDMRQAAAPLFWSPDSQSVAFDAGGVLKRGDVAGGLPQTVCELSFPAIGGSWNKDGVILFGNVAAGIMRVAASGGTPVPVTTVNASRREDTHMVPVFLPDGRHFLYLGVSRTAPENSGVFLGSLDAKPGAQDPTRLIASTTGPAYASSSDGALGRILFVRDGNLVSQSFDERQLRLVGAPTVVAERVGSYRDTMMASASGADVLVYRAADDEMALEWFDRQGKSAGRLKDRGLFASVDLSPDGSHAIVSRLLPTMGGASELSVLDLARDASSRFTTVAVLSEAIWSGDGRSIAFVSRSERGTLFRKLAAGGPDEQLLDSRQPKTPTSWSRDGRFLMYSTVDPKTNSDLWVLSLDGERSAKPFLNTDASESQAQFSPVEANGVRLVAYTSNESGRDEVYVRTFPDSGRKEIVSTAGGHSPRWRGDGRELLYVAGDRSIMAVGVSAAGALAGIPKSLFLAPAGFGSRDATGSRGRAPWAVTPDGQRFLFAAPTGQTAQAPFTVVLNWPAALKR
jgi:Tol biopolymer transport system component/predicted Ser/Thr protein kinase